MYSLDVQAYSNPIVLVGLTADSNTLSTVSLSAQRLKCGFGCHGQRAQDP